MGIGENIERLFHEPARLIVMTELCGAKGGLSFSQLKSSCNLTDGNLSRHLAALEKAQAVSIQKTFVGSKPRTTIAVTLRGRRDFLKYLDALEDLLAAALRKARPERLRLLPTLKPVR